MTESDPLRILLAEDDKDDHTLISMALARAPVPVKLDWVQDGEDLLHHLRNAANNGGDLPDLVLLDLNMPRMDGREALAELRRVEGLRQMPVVVLTTSNAESDILTCYTLGANGYVQKPSDFATLARDLGILTEYWGRVVTLPPPASAAHPVHR